MNSERGSMQVSINTDDTPDKMETFFILTSGNDSST